MKELNDAYSIWTNRARNLICYLDDESKPAEKRLKAYALFIEMYLRCTSLIQFYSKIQSLTYKPTNFKSGGIK